MDQGNVEAQLRLGRLVHQGGDGLKQDLVMAAQLYQAAAELGSIEAQNWLGYCFQHGIGVEANDERAVEWYRRSADGGFAPAQSNLGLMYLTGRGTERSLLRAFEVFSESAAQGDGWGLNNLGGMYEMGWAVSKDSRRALEYYGKAVETGNQSAEDNLARLSAIVEGRPLPVPAAAEHPRRIGQPRRRPQRLRHRRQNHASRPGNHLCTRQRNASASVMMAVQSGKLPLSALTINDYRSFTSIGSDGDWS